MIPVELRLRYHPQRQRPTAACLLPGEHASDWLQAIAAFNLSDANTTLLVLPRSRADVSSAAALLLLPAEVPEDHLSRHRDTFIATRQYGVLGDGDHGAKLCANLYLPVEASLEPHGSEAEWKSIVPSDVAAYIWHPHLGLISFEASDLITARDLIAIPEIHESDWSYGQSGNVFPHRITSVEASLSESAQEMLEQGADGIGSKASSTQSLGQGWKKSLEGPANIAKALLLAPIWLLAKLLSKFSSPTASTPTWIDRFQQWKSQSQKEVQQDLSGRNRELKRLMKMLDENPDEGLQYALPMTGNPNASAGQGSRGSTLVRRDALFSLSRIFGAGPADVWDVPPEMQLELLKRYRGLAEREVRLGRPRRAAYIYAELLGDVSSAAKTLENAHHHRDAAILYRDKLHRHAEAAACLERGGLLHEAIPLYKSLKQWDSIGRIYRRLGDEEEACAAYQQHADHLISRQDFIAAAKTLEGDLRSPDAAIQLLNENWPKSSSKRECLALSFEMMGQHNQHEAAARQVQTLIDSSRNLVARHLPVVEALAGAATQYPDQRVRAQAADATRVLVSHSLLSDTPAPGPMLRALEQLTPADLLLKRDTTRYQGQLKASRKKRTRTPVKRRKHEYPAQVVLTLGLAKELIWGAFSVSSNFLCAAGFGTRFEPTLAIFQYDPPREFGHFSWGSVSAFSGGVSALPGRLALEIDERGEKIVLFWQNSPLAVKEIQVPESLTPFYAGTPRWLSKNTIGLAVCSGTTWSVEAETLSLTGHSQTGVPIAVRQLTPPPDFTWSSSSRLPMWATQYEVYVALGSNLTQVASSDRERIIEFDQPIVSLTGTAPGTLNRMAVFFENGGEVIWPGLTEDLRFSLSADLKNPRGVFLRNGNLVIQAEETWQLYSTADRKLQFLGPITNVTNEPDTQLLRQARNNQFLVTDGKTVTSYELSGDA